jgi:hypothetical protein
MDSVTGIATEKIAKLQERTSALPPTLKEKLRADPEIRLALSSLEELTKRISTAAEVSSDDLLEVEILQDTLVDSWTAKLDAAEAETPRAEPARDPKFLGTTCPFCGLVLAEEGKGDPVKFRQHIESVHPDQWASAAPKIDESAQRIVDEIVNSNRPKSTTKRKLYPKIK